jgi:Spy/CpxP family protein refolding chaperone
MKADDSSGIPTRASGARPLFWWPFTLIALTTVLLLVAGRVSAWRGSDGDEDGAFRRHAERMLDRALDEVDATDEQATEIRAIGDEIFELVATAHADRQSDGDALRAALSAEPLDRAALEAIRSAHVARAGTLSADIATRLADALEVLTPDQRQRLIARADEFRAHHRDHHAHRDPGDHGGHEGHRRGQPRAESPPETERPAEDGA